MIQLAATIGLDKDTAKKVLTSNDYADAVERDIYEAHQIGVRGVPYFVLNDRYAISGAHATETFLGALTKAWGEYENERPALPDLNMNNETACTPDGGCN